MLTNGKTERWKGKQETCQKGTSSAEGFSECNCQLKDIQAANEREETERQEKIEKTQEQMKASNDYYSSGAANPNSISAKARMVQKYNDKHSK